LELRALTFNNPHQATANSVITGEINEQYKEKRRLALAQAPCTNQPLPDDFIRLRHGTYYIESSPH